MEEIRKLDNKKRYANFTNKFLFINLFMSINLNIIKKVYFEILLTFKKFFLELLRYMYTKIL